MDRSGSWIIARTSLPLQHEVDPKNEIIPLELVLYHQQRTQSEGHDDYMSENISKTEPDDQQTRFPIFLDKHSRKVLLFDVGGSDQEYASDSWQLYQKLVVLVNETTRSDSGALQQE